MTSSSFNFGPEGSSLCNLTEEIPSDDMGNISKSESHNLVISFRKTGRVIESETRKWQWYHWITVCSCILSIACFIFLIFVTSAIFQKGEYGDDLMTRLDELRKDVTENHELINTANTRLNSDCMYHQNLLNSSNPVNVTQLECGGLIRVPPEGHSITLDYKSTEVYNNNENCLWILDTAVANVRSNVKLKITLMCEGLSDAEDTLFLLDWRRDRWFENRFIPHRLRKKGDTVAPERYSSYLYLSFSTNEAMTGSGFIIRLKTKSVKETFSGSNWAFTSSPGNFAYGPNKQDDRTVVVINSKSSSSSSFNVTTFWELKVTFDSNPNLKGYCDYHDPGTLFIVAMELGGRSTVLESICGKSEAVVKTEYPIWVEYWNSESANGTGFTLSWSNYTSE